MTNPNPMPRSLRVADLKPSREVEIDLRPTDAELAELRDALDLIDLRKVRMEGTLRPLGKSDWRLVARLGATVIQPCVATLEPVTTRIDTEIARSFLTDYEEPDEEEAEMPEDDSAEPLGTHIDLMSVLAEVLSLSLPLYPRSDSAEEVSVQVTEPGKTAMTDEDTKPFAGLAALKDKLGPSES